MQLSTELAKKMADEIMAQEVTRLLNLKRDEISKAARIAVDKVLTTKLINAHIKKAVTAQAKEFDKSVKEAVAKYLNDYDFEDLVSDFIEGDAFYKIFNNIIKEQLRQGIKIK